MPSLTTLGKFHNFVKCFYYGHIEDKCPPGSFREMVVSICCRVESVRKYVLMGNFNNRAGVTSLKFGFTEHIFQRSLHNQSIICILNKIASLLPPIRATEIVECERKYMDRSSQNLQSSSSY